MTPSEFKDNINALIKDEKSPPVTTALNMILNLYNDNRLFLQDYSQAVISYEERIAGLYNDLVSYSHFRPSELHSFVDSIVNRINSGGSVFHSFVRIPSANIINNSSATSHEEQDMVDYPYKQDLYGQIDDQSS